ncbi:hypothetical protein Taro_006640 [Colocasia esculenta]|uniref:Uncharacterized protein n=1 Tax=Colocasia esculenta TaxID=4460 RepID=A0A843TWL4_COLES|nr:hypothetical protein [Colocasia esculenta]
MKRARAEGVRAAGRGRVAGVLPTLPLPLEGQGEGEGARASEREREAGGPLPALLLPRAGRGEARERRARPGCVGEGARPTGRERGAGGPLPALLLPLAGRDEARVRCSEGVRAAWVRGRRPSAPVCFFRGRGGTRRGWGGMRRGRLGCVGARGRRERARDWWSSAPVCFFHGQDEAGRGEARAGRLLPALLFEYIYIAPPPVKIRVCGSHEDETLE